MVKLSTCSVIVIHKYIQVFLQAESSMTGRVYMRKVLIQVWLKSIKLPKAYKKVCNENEIP